MRLARRLLHIEVVKQKLDEMKREAQEETARADELRTRLEEATAMVDGLVVEARSTLKRAIAFLEREGLRGNGNGNGNEKSAPRGAPDAEARRAEVKTGTSDAPSARRSSRS